MTCPPMRAVMDEFLDAFEERGWEPVLPPVVQTLNEGELERLVPDVDGWISGDDPVTRRVLAAGKAGRLRAVVKWGVGTDNVDFDAAEQLGVPVTNTPGAFAEEVADLALGYVVALARETFQIDRGVRAGKWPKPVGISLRGKTVALAGLGNIGRQVARRLHFLGMHVIGYDPYAPADVGVPVERSVWPTGLDLADFIVLTCPLTAETRHMLDEGSLRLVKSGARLVNVARGPLVDETALVNSLRAGVLAGAALDVFEQEPLGANHALRSIDSCVFGSHNASNTREGARAATLVAINRMAEFLGKPEVPS